LNKEASLKLMESDEWVHTLGVVVVNKIGIDYPFLFSIIWLKHHE